MRYNINTGTLKKIFSAIQLICQKKTISEFTQNALLLLSKKFCTIKATDLESFVQISFSFTTIVHNDDNEHVALVNAKRFYDLIKDINEDEISLLIEQSHMTIQSPTMEINLSLCKIDEFPFFDDRSVENILSVSNKLLMSMVSYCLPLALNGASKLGTAGIGSIYFQFADNFFKITTTDGHCLAHGLAQMEHSIEKNFEFLISRKAAADLKKILELEGEEASIVIGKSNEGEIVFSGQNFSIFIKPLREKFPEYTSIINIKGATEFQYNVPQLENIFKRLSCMTGGKFLPSQLKYDLAVSNNIVASIANPAIGKMNEEIKVTLNHEIKDHNKFIISIYPLYVLQAIIALETEELKGNLIGKMMVREEKRPIVFVKKDLFEKYYAIMPMVSN